MGRSNQGRLFGAQAFGVCTRGPPTCPVPDVDGAQRCGMPGFGLNILAQTLEQGSLLATGNEYVCITTQMLSGRLHVMAAQLIHRDDLLGGCGLAQRLWIKGLCFITTAQQ